MPELKRWLVYALYRMLFVLTSMLLGIVFPVRVSGSRNVPRTGPLLILANHQSFLDPLLIGLTIPRRPYYVARSTLFRFRPFRWFIATLGAIPIDQEGFAKEGMRNTLQRLKAGHSVVLYPEGTRTYDGDLSPLQPGVLLLLRRIETPVVLVGITGAYESYPIHGRVPIPTPIWVHYEQWIPSGKRGSRESLAELEVRLAEVVGVSEQRRRRLRRFCPSEWIRNVIPHR